jgi:hypothetical protein
MSATEEILEEALDVGEEIMDTLEETTRGLRGVELVIFGAVCGAIGGTAAYLVGSRFLKAKYEKIAEEEIAQAKEYYKVLHKNGELSTPEGAARSRALVQEAHTLKADADKAQAEYEGVELVEAELPEEDTEEKVNVFMQSHTDPNFNLEEEMQNRSPDHPYVISQEEFLQAEPEFHQSSITYYAGDGALADEKDKEIPLIDPIVGEENLERFGHGSGDSRVVYIRNEKLETDFEVLMSDGKYAHEVLGLEHADGGFRGRRLVNEPRKFKGYDD